MLIIQGAWFDVYGDTVYIYGIIINSVPTTIPIILLFCEFNIDKIKISPPKIIGSSTNIFLDFLFRFIRYPSFVNKKYNNF